MSLRMIEAIVPARYEGEMRQLLIEANLIDWWDFATSGQRHVFRLLTTVESAEAVLDQLELTFDFEDEFRVVLTPVEASHPWKRPKRSGLGRFMSLRMGRVSRMELYQDIYYACGLTPMFLAMVALSTVVASVGLLRNNVSAIIGAMVIAPLLGPNAALALAITLGDGRLFARALSSAVAGLLLAFGMAATLGHFAPIDPSIHEIAVRTEITLFDLGIALAAGVAGSLAFTTGVPASMVGVMVAVALLPPTVVFGMLVGSQQWAPATGAGLILLANVAAVNLTAVGTFLTLGVRPRILTKARGARLLSIAALLLWLAFLAAIAVAVARRYSG